MGELRATEAADEVAPPDAPRLLEGAEHGVERAEAPGYSLGGDRVAGEDAMAREKLLGPREEALGGRRRFSSARGLEQAPPARGGRRRMAPRAKGLETARAAFAPGGTSVQEGPQGGRGVVRDLPAHTRSQSASSTSCSRPRPAAA